MPYTPPSRSVSHNGTNSITASGQDAFRNFMSHKNDSATSIASRKKFFLLDGDGSEESIPASSQEKKPPSPLSYNNEITNSPYLNSGLTNSIIPDLHNGSSETLNSVSKLLKFTTESPQSYSYTLMSTNSLALRLNVLKRSLEILLERPEWLSCNIPMDYFPVLDLDSQGNSQSLPSPKAKISNNPIKEMIRLERNASSSTLQSLLQSAQRSRDGTPNISRLSTISSSPPNKILASNNPTIASTGTSPASISISPTLESIKMDQTMLDDLKELIELLENDIGQPQLTTDQTDKVINLHNLSLSNAEDVSKKTFLKIQLLHALATPFIEQNSTRKLAGLPFLQTTASSVGLSSLNNSNNNSNNEYTTVNRQFHASSTGKNKSPKAIFTCDLNAPWHLRNANDLGLLMFGITKNSLNTLKLMDLIAPRSRDMVFNRLSRGLELVFSGEIIAVKRDNRGLAWTSLWAKRKDNFIILIFEQVVCETIDLVIGRSITPSSSYEVKSVIKQSKSLFHDDLLNTDLSFFAPSMDHVLSSSYASENLSGLQTCTKDSILINKIRYFTLKLSDSSLVPCAVTSEPLGDDAHEVESSIRINLHSLPYMAGSFVISSKNYEIVSFNEAIAKNLFGTGELKNQPIDLILPGFKKLLITAMEENPNLNYQEGLVLPEHYFRKLNAWKTGNTDEERELLFLNSKGLEGLHNDGNKIKVDVQLHIAEHNLFILWITFCRTFSSKVHKFPMLGGDKPSHMAISTGSSDSSDSSNVPSQLKLMKQVENDIASVGSSSVDSLSRTSSIRTIDQSALSSPVTPKIARIQSASSRSNLISQQQLPQPQLVEVPSGKSDSDESNNEDSLGASNFRLSKATSCALHLLEEEKHLTYLRLMCPHFPHTIGAERRTKKFSDFRVVKNLGQGAYGKVVIGEHKLDPIYRVCIKAIFKERILVDTWVRDRQLGTIPSEIQILNALNSKPHANIMRIVDFFEDENCYYLETLQHGDDGVGAVDLFDLIEVKNDMSEFEAKYIYFQIAAALEHMHKLGIVHRDIKDENMIVDKDYFVKVIDFGSAAYTKNAPFGVFVGTIDYAAPEVLNGQPYDGKAQDVWAMGVLLYTLVFKENPFCSVDEILDGELKFPIYGNGVSEECIDLIKSILITNVNKRPTMSDIMQHCWLKDIC